MTAVDARALTESTGRLIRTNAAAVVLGETDADDLAVVVLAQPAIADALAAVSVVDQLRALHQPVPRVEGSYDVVCRHCLIGWPCRHAEILGVVA